MLDIEAIIVLWSSVVTSATVSAAFANDIFALRDRLPVGERGITRDRAEVERILGLDRPGKMAFRNDNCHPLYRNDIHIHPDNRLALTALSGQRAVQAEAQGGLAVHDSVVAALDDNLTLVGSATSEGLSRIIFGYEPDAVDPNRLVLRDAPVELPYEMILDPHDLPGTRQAKRWVSGRGLTARPNWRIRNTVSDQPFFPELDEDGMLVTDLLLVTRLRNFLTPTAYDSGSFVLSVAGTHGVGTKGAQILLRDKSAIRAIAEITRRNRDSSFQALFRVSGIRHDKVKGSLARTIELVEPPKLIPDRQQQWEVAAKTVRTRVDGWRKSGEPPA